jgi:hypothetical protein
MKQGEIYLVTSYGKHHSNQIIWKYYNMYLAIKDYNELKKCKYRNVQLSKII